MFWVLAQVEIAVVVKVSFIFYCALLGMFHIDIYVDSTKWPPLYALVTCKLHFSSLKQCVACYEIWTFSIRFLASRQNFPLLKRERDNAQTNVVLRAVNSKLNWNDKLAAIFETKLTFNRPSSSVPFYCICRRGWHHFPEI